MTHAPQSVSGHTHISDKWIVALTGASGTQYGLRLVEVLCSQVSEVHVIVSEAALRVMQEEQQMKISQSALNSKALFGKYFSNLVFHNVRDIGASVASGSALMTGMVVIPCSMSSLASIANGIGSNLIHRAADVTLKEGRKLILVPRETPLSAIHLENMLRLSRMGVSMVPAMPGFYHQPQTVSDVVDMMVMKVLDQMGIRTSLVERWGEDETKSPLRIAVTGAA